MTTAKNNPNRQATEIYRDRALCRGLGRKFSSRWMDESTEAGYHPHHQHRAGGSECADV